MFISVGETLVSDTNQSAISVLSRSNLIGSICTYRFYKAKDSTDLCGLTVGKPVFIWEAHFLILGFFDE